MFELIRRLFFKNKVRPDDACPAVSLKVTRAVCLDPRPLLRQEDFDRIDRTHASLQEDIQTTKDQAKQLAAKMSSELERAKLRASIISDSLMDPLISVDFNGEILSTNSTVERILGYTETDLLGHSITEFLRSELDLVEVFRNEARQYIAHIETNRPTYLNGYKERYRRYIKDSEFLNKIRRATFYTQDGDPLAVEVCINVLNIDCEEAANIVFLLVIHDDTDHIEAMSEVESLVQFQSSLLAALPNPVFYKDETLKVLGGNKAFDEFIGQKALNYAGKTNKQLFEPATAVEFDLIEHSLEDPSAADVQIHRLQFKTPSMLYAKEVMVYCTALRGATEQFKGVLTTLVDLTDLLSLRRFKEALIHSIPAPVYYLDRDLRYIGCNDRYAELLGLKAADIIGKAREEVFPNANDLVNGVIAQAYRQKDFEILTETQPVQSYETQCYNAKTKTFLDIVVYRSVLRTLEGKFDGIISVVADVSEIRAAQQFHQCIFDGLPIPVFYKDANLVYSACNELYARWFKLSTFEVLGKTREQLYDYAKRLFEERPEYAENAEVIERSYRDLAIRYKSYEEDLLRSAKIERLGVSISEERLFNFELNQARDVILYRHAIVHNGVFEGIVGSLIDISELRQLEHFKKEVLETFPVAVCCKDLNGRVVSSNALYQSMIGSVESEPSGADGLTCVDVYNASKHRVETMIVFCTNVDDHILYIYFAKDNIPCPN